MSDSQKAINSDSGGIKTKWIIVTICLIVVILLGLYFVNFPHHLSDKNEVWGTFGDYFGGILNPVIAAFAFYLIAKSYELQKRELEETRKLLEISTKAQDAQVKLAALTALLNSNLTKISILEAKKEKLEDNREVVRVIGKLNDGYPYNFAHYESYQDFKDIVVHSIATIIEKEVWGITPQKTECLKQSTFEYFEIDYLAYTNDNLIEQINDFLKI